METLDYRGLTCPEPVIRTKRALEQSPDGISVLLDDGTPRENVRRFARSRNYNITETAAGDHFILQIYAANGQKQATPQPAKQITATQTTGSGKVLLVTSNQLGNGAEELGCLLMNNFIHTLLETGSRPDKIVFLNSGVLLAVQGAETVEALEQLVNMGVEILSCGLCLDFYHKKEQLAVGMATNMFATAELLLDAASVIRI